MFLCGKVFACVHKALVSNPNNGEEEIEEEGG